MPQLDELKFSRPEARRLGYPHASAQAEAPAVVSVSSDTPSSLPCAADELSGVAVGADSAFRGAGATTSSNNREYAQQQLSGDTVTAGMESEAPERGRKSTPVRVLERVSQSGTRTPSIKQLLYQQALDRQIKEKEERKEKERQQRLQEQAEERRLMDEAFERERRTMRGRKSVLKILEENSVSLQEPGNRSVALLASTSPLCAG